MKATVENNNITIVDPTPHVVNHLSKLLSYTDKSKQFQLRKMGKNPFTRKTEKYKQLEREIHGSLLYRNDQGDIVIPSGFAHLLSNIDLKDERELNGKNISLPWKTKPFSLRPYQSEAVSLMEQNYRGLINFATGCHEAGQLILMLNGTLKKVEDIQVNEQIMGPDGTARTILELHTGREEMFKITPTKGESFIVNKGHILSLQKSYNRRIGKNRFTHKTGTPDTDIVNITVGEYIQQTKAFKHKYKLYRSSLIHFKEQTQPIPPYILGLWLGDGCKRNPMITTEDSEIVDELQTYADSSNQKLNKLNPQGNAYDYSITGNTRTSPTSLRSLLKSNNLYMNKHVPEIYRVASVNQRLELLAGLLDSDGCLVNKTIFDITQKNKQIAESVVFIARSLGFAAYMKESFKAAMNSEEKIKNKYYRVSIHGDVCKIPTRVQRKKANERQQAKNVLRVGFKISKIDVGNYYGFTVDKDNLYLMGDFTVTHNSGKTLTMVHAIRKFKKKTLVICPNISIADNFYNELVSAFGEDRIGYFGNGEKKIKDITVGIVTSVNNNVKLFKKADLGLIVYDEVHHLAATTFFNIALELGHVGRMFGLTATDFRSDGKDILITAGVGPTIIKKDIVWCIRNKWLADPYIIMREVETTGRDYAGDKLKNYKEHVLNSSEMNNRIIADCQKFLAAGKSLLCLVDQVAHGKIIADQLGLQFATGKNKKSGEYIKQLNDGTIPGLIATAKFAGEGTDTKRVDVLVLANFVASKGLLLQNLGRGLRVYNGNDKVIVLDYCPLGSSMLKRHAKQRLEYYKEITDNVSIR